MNRIVLILLVIILSNQSLFAQNETVGLLYSDQDPGVDYVLFNPEKSNSSYLINQCGEVVNQWTFNSSPGITAYILENGNILQSGRDGLEIRNWENDLLWSFDLNLLGYNKHHDIEPLPNGNILALIHDEYTTDEMIALGKDPATIGSSFKLDKIIEVQPVSTNFANIVWEWKFLDHIIQDYDNSKPNFGIAADHPELLDFNHSLSYPEDFTHANGIDYNAELDQILISARHTSEIYIIDHSTTTLEASGHSGGDYEKGGDFLWRFGNVAAYGAGSESDQKLRLQHDAKWITSVNPEENNISVFNNGSDGTPNQSSVHKLSPLDSLGHYKIINNTFLNQEFTDSWTGLIHGVQINEGKKSGVQVLSNGNYLITETSKGKVSEVNSTTGVVWSYINPVGLLVTYDQFDELDISSTSNQFFRGENYNADFPGFVGKDMSGNGIIEDINNNSSSCTLGLPESGNTSNISIINSLSDGTIFLNDSFNGTAQVYNLSGQLVASTRVNSTNSFNVRLKQGMYIVQLVENKQPLFSSKIILK